MSGVERRPCRYCRAAFGDSADDLCQFTHDRPVDEVGPLATAMARLFQHRHPTDEQIGWFMDDADAVIGDFDPLPDKWRLRKLATTARDGFVARFQINQVTYVIENGEGHCTPVRLSTLRAWEREADRSVS